MDRLTEREKEREKVYIQTINFVNLGSLNFLWGGGGPENLECFVYFFNKPPIKVS